jgi:uncharacterized protein GlcG (DUF336 family)
MTLPAQLAQHALSLSEVCAFYGGAPIKIEGEVVGGVGVSGGSGEQEASSEDIRVLPDRYVEFRRGM